jgi:hypothetical protein
MAHAGFNNRGVAGQIGVHHSVIDRLMQHLQATAMVDERPRSGKTRKTTPCENCHCVIGGLDRRFVIGNKSIGQTKVEIYCNPWIAVSESDGLYTLNFMTGTVGGVGVNVWGAFHLIIS